MALVEEYQHALSVANVGGIRDLNVVFEQLGLRSSPQVGDSLEISLSCSMSSMRVFLSGVVWIELVER